MPDQPDKDSKLNVMGGVKQPSSLNPALRQRRRQRKAPTLDDYVQGILDGNRILLSRAITLVESKLPEHQQLAQSIIERCLPQAGRSVRIGITGTPGVGKSTFIEALGQHVLQQQNKLAVLAIDPSSQLSKGSILGDKTRMEQLATNPRAFIRPSPAGDSLGGVARKTRETILLCEAAGFDTIIVETVGVGQSEIAVHSMVDFFLLLLLPGAGDELQGIKRGIVEMADMIAVNKADGDRQALARRAKREYRSALHLFPPKESQWIARVESCSAITGKGLPEIWQAIQDFLQLTRENSYFDLHRRQQAQYWLKETVNQRLQQLFYQHPEVKKNLEQIEQQVLKGQLTSFQGAEILLEAMRK